MKKVLSFQILVSLTLGLPYTASAQTWNGSTRLEKTAESQLNISVLQFTQGQTDVTFRPTEPPLVAVSLEKVVFANRSPFFISTWVQGARSVLFRIFDPENAGSTPLCEVISFGESTQARIKDGELQIQVLPTAESDKKNWTRCHTLIDREAQSVKPQKKIPTKTK